MKFRSIISVAVLGLGIISPGVLNAAADNEPATLNVITGTTIALTSGQNSFIKSTEVMTKEDDGIFTAEFTLNKTNGYYFAFYAGSTSFINDTNYPLGPDTTGEPVQVNLTPQESQEYTVEANKGLVKGSCWKWENEDEEIVLSAKVNWNEMTVEFTNNTEEQETYTVTLTFFDEAKKIPSGGVFRFATVKNRDNNFDYEVKKNPYEFQYTTEPVRLIIQGIDGYEVVSLECDNYTGDADNAPFTISGLGNAETGYKNVRAGLNLTTAANGLDFNVVLSKNPDEFSGVETVTDNNEDSPVFNLEGVKVLDSKELINTLPKGIYISGGKKVVK